MAATELWFVELNKSEDALETLEIATPRLSDDIQKRLDRMSDAAARRERRLAHIALRFLLEARLGSGIRGAEFSRSAHGKPSLVGHETAFSLSHAGPLALIAIADHDPLGVDIEVGRQVRVPDHRRAPIEAEAVELAAGVPLAGTDADARFLRAWVRLEAAAKAQGRGIGAVLERLRPGSPPATPRSPAVAVYDVPVSEEVYAALALPPGDAPPPVQVLPDTATALDSLLSSKLGTRR